MSDKQLPPAKPITRFEAEMPTPGRSLRDNGARLSLIVVAYNMPEQLDRTLHSLSLDYQRGARAEDYEVIVVENRSGNDLGDERATRHRGNFSYFLRDETAPTPIHAINFGIGEATGDFVAIMIDGARMLSPGVIAWTLAALDQNRQSVVCVPGYHLGEELQQKAAARGYSSAHEAELLQTINWPEDGYRLFDISCSAGTSAGGFFKPIGESNCIALHRDRLAALGGFDAAFTARGGGLVNLDFYKRALESEGAQLVVLPGEGSFHQFHGGETTGQSVEDRQQVITDMAQEYVDLRGERFSPPPRRAVYFGPVPDSALRFLQRSCESVIRLNGLDAIPVRRPLLSVVVVGFRMAEQLARTLYTLSADYQRNIDPKNYEVIVVENASEQALAAEALASLSGQFRYFLREEAGSSPVHALNFGLSQARGEQVGVMIDGAHMLTPRVLEMALNAARAFPSHLIGVPVYHLGPDEQNRSVHEGFNEAAQDTLLASVNWQADGYELLSISVWCDANRHGFMQPLMESNCYFAPRAHLERLGFADTRFEDAGGGALNLHMYRLLGLFPHSNYVVLHGEGSCHQFHGGVTSNSTREEVSDRFQQQLQNIWGDEYRALTREPLYFGSVSPQAQRHLSEASKRAERRNKRLRNSNLPVWPDQPAASLDALPLAKKD